MCREEESVHGAQQVRLVCIRLLNLKYLLNFTLKKVNIIKAQAGARLVVPMQNPPPFPANSADKPELAIYSQTLHLLGI